MSDKNYGTGAEPTPAAPVPSRAKAGPGRGGSKKISRRLVVLGAMSILAVWAAGYVGSSAAASQVNSAVPPVVAVSSNSTVSATATSTTATGQYKDGTYVGQGSSRHGGIQVQVVVQNGKVVSANITGSSTRYPISDIASLPGLVVSQQSANIDLVSGATDSSSAFIQAVGNALAQAA